MPERFDDVIRETLTSGTETHHEVMPGDFGEPGSRRSLFTRCMKLLTERYPGIRIRITGDSAALTSIGLIANGEMLVGTQIYRTRTGPTAQPGTVRLTFSRKPPA